MNKKVLFVSHDASRTGAPLVLLDLIKWIKANTDIQVDVLLLEGGDLVKSFKEISRVDFLRGKMIYSEYYLIRLCSFLITKFSKMILGFNLNQKVVLWKIKRKKYDLFYLNTIVSSYMAPILKDERAKIINHIHELSLSIALVDDKLIDIDNRFVDLYITVSILAKENLHRYGIDKNNISLVYPLFSVSHKSIPTIEMDTMKNSFHFPKNTFIVGASGTMHRRKGIDLFFQLSWLVQKKFPDAEIQFIWVGGINNDELEWYSYETALQDLTENIHFTDIQDQPQNYFQIFDVFTLVSREDPFPLVCLEAAALAKPILCFKGAGGIQEFVDQGAGFVISYHDLDEMANKIYEFYNNRDLAMKIGQRAKELVKEYDVSVIAPRILSEIEKVLDK